MQPAEIEMTKLTDIRPKINRGRSSLMPLAVAAALGVPANVLAQHAFHTLDMLPTGIGCGVNGISGDGTTAVGYVIDPEHRVYPASWTAQVLALVPPGVPGGSAFAVSQDGSTVTGFIQPGNAAFRWTDFGGLQMLGALPNLSSCAGYTTAADGSIIYGRCNGPGGSQPFRWTESGGMVGLGTIPGVNNLTATDCSADGQIVVTSSGFRWAAATGYVPLPILPGSFGCHAVAISGDGRVVVGYCGTPQGDRAFRWSEQEGTVAINLPTPGVLQALAVNWDGTVIGGRSHAPRPTWGAWVWTPQSGVVFLQSLLGSAIPPADELYSVTGISDDGLTVTGSMNSPGTIGAAYIARLAFLPCTANCDNSTTIPVLNVDDFTCFINQFAAAAALPHAQQLTHYANCDGSTIAPALNVDDFTCFINRFAQGCP
jgi:uncharacterized membrane protein